MPDFALLKNGVVEDIRSYPSQPDNLPHKGVTWLPYLVVKPDYTPATQIRTGPVRAIDTAVTDTWTVRDKTAQELAAEADAAKDEEVAAISRVLFIIAFDHENRIRALEGKAAVTTAQFRAAVKARL